MVEGYEKLSKSDQNLFESFCINYRNANSLEIEIAFVSVKREEGCLRVDMLKNGRKTYQEVFTSTAWG